MINLNGSNFHSIDCATAHGRAKAEKTREKQRNKEIREAKADLRKKDKIAKEQRKKDKDRVKKRSE